MDLVSTPATAAVPAEFAPVLDHLERLSRDHNLFFRLEVGRAMLDAFFASEPAAYLSRDPTKPSKFTEFARTCRVRLDDLGLGEAVLRRCIVTRVVYDGLPRELAGQLRFTHLVELAKVTDGATRSLLATASVDNAWSADQLRDAVLAARAGRWIDGQPDVPGLQPPPAPPDTRRPPQLGRVVTQFERTVADVDALAASWEQVATKKISRAQRKRLEDAVAALEARVAGLRRGLAG